MCEGVKLNFLFFSLLNLPIIKSGSAPPVPAVICISILSLQS